MPQMALTGWFEKELSYLLSDGQVLLGTKSANCAENEQICVAFTGKEQGNTPASQELAR